MLNLPPEFVKQTKKREERDRKRCPIPVQQQPNVIWGNISIEQRNLQDKML